MALFIVLPVLEYCVLYVSKQICVSVNEFRMTIEINRGNCKTMVLSLYSNILGLYDKPLGQGHILPSRHKKFTRGCQFCDRWAC